MASLDALCCVADAIGDAFAVFVPSLSALLTRLGVHHPRYLELVGSLEPLLPPPPNNAPAAALRLFGSGRRRRLRRRLGGGIGLEPRVGRAEHPEGSEEL